MVVREKDPMRLLVVQHVFDCPAGLVAERAAARGWALDTVQIHRGESLPADPGDHDALLVLGGAMAATDDLAHPHLPLTCDLIRAFAAENRQVLGICLGAQLIARAFGGTNHIRRGHEIGYQPLVTLPGGLRDPLLHGLPERPWLIQWHEDSFDLPAGARLLMAGTQFRNQLFRIGPCVGIQAHVEATAERFRQWLIYAGPEMELRVPDMWERFATEDERLGAATRSWADGFIDRWLDRVAESRRPALAA